MTPIQKLISLLNVKSSHDGRYRCQCPAHGSKGGTLAVKEDDSGKVLLHCHAGCEPYDILASIGLTMSDLFPEGTKTYVKPDLRHERLILEMTRDARNRGEELTKLDINRAELALHRIKTVESM